MARCPLTRGGIDGLGCCRVAEHPTDDGPPEHSGCCLHWAGFIRGIGEPHQVRMRAGSGHPLGCAKGIALDGG